MCQPESAVAKCKSRSDFPCTVMSCACHYISMPAHIYLAEMGRGVQSFPNGAKGLHSKPSAVGEAYAPASVPADGDVDSDHKARRNEKQTEQKKSRTTCGTEIEIGKVRYRSQKTDQLPSGFCFDLINLIPREMEHLMHQGRSPRHCMPAHDAAAERAITANTQMRAHRK